jgi:hypothetical protein
MNISQQLAKQFRDVHFGGNWTSVDLQTVLSDISYEEAFLKPGSFNTIAALVFHIHYYIREVTRLLEGGTLNAKDEFSFNLPVLNNETEWKDFLENTWKAAMHFAELIEHLPEEKLREDFTNGKYGTFFRNLSGITEHTHYHLGQIVILKKLIRKE